MGQGNEEVLMANCVCISVQHRSGIFVPIFLFSLSVDYISFGSRDEFTLCSSYFFSRERQRFNNNKCSILGGSDW